MGLAMVLEILLVSEALTGIMAGSRSQTVLEEENDLALSQAVSLLHQ